MLIWGQITPKLAPDLTAMPTALYVPRAMLSVYFNRLCSAWCSKGTTQTRGQEQSGQWLVGTYQAFSPRSTHLHLGQRRQHNSAIQRRDSSFTWSKMWMHTAQRGALSLCEHIWFKPQKYLEVTQQVLTVRPTHNRDVFRGSLEERVEKGKEHLL